MHKTFKQFKLKAKIEIQEFSFWNSRTGIMLACKERKNLLVMSLEIKTKSRTTITKPKKKHNTVLVLILEILWYASWTESTI